MEAGRHVYAEKPCAMTEEDLDAIIAASRSTGRRFHEMAGTAFDQPYLAMRNLVAAGGIGTVVQVFAQKSYPYHDRRPQDEDIDGGIIGQASVHALRFVEHVAGQRIADIQAVETRLGNPVADGGLRMATALILTLENGGVASVIANYLNPKGFGRWGNEHLRIFGTRGFVESTDGGARTRLVVGDKDLGAIDTSAPSREYFDMFVESLLGLTEMPFSMEEELHPTRMTIRAKRSATRDP
jgi:predicted dehydrogenase